MSGPHRESDENDMPVFDEVCEERDTLLVEVERLDARLAALTADRDALAALLGEAVSLLSIGISIAESYSDDDQVGCLCIGDCYCRSGRLEELKQARKSLAARIDAASGRRG